MKTKSEIADEIRRSIRKLNKVVKKAEQAGLKVEITGNSGFSQSQKKEVEYEAKISEVILF